MANVLTIVFDKIEPKLDSVIAAAVNELHSIGHLVKEVRLTGDSGEVKVALNTVEGLIPQEIKTEVGSLATAAKEVVDTVENKAPDGTSPVVPTSKVPDANLPEDVPPSLVVPPSATSEAAAAVTPPTIDEKRLALLEQLDALDHEEATATPPTPVDPTPVDPTPPASVLTNDPSTVAGS